MHEWSLVANDIWDTNFLNTAHQFICGAIFSSEGASNMALGNGLLCNGTRITFPTGLTKPNFCIPKINFKILASIPFKAQYKTSKQNIGIKEKPGKRLTVLNNKMKKGSFYPI